ncbi:hypothetical protein lacNasYZ03_07010 [Lactobacillus nasalidis]|uniref:Nucleotidyl transferase AbiEii/AbiGii toxin family protein n=1 Tax=Lactobacillus nasalidis TaxID=2797258 RepID=A0ABQ3W7E5_9LACO|nr:hypothetical protein [Lactobacillus nasalidis]GHV98469.1 hypothetical protein lacNasYZ01_16510 [Lactobacillus nasalidis]GHV98923.1 hypothetical protein lacNasYZ02_03530 [Lactobacillus nasalidis]GHW01014.1 hypothetical protein lacNasYZ03_07010 [Lactobacillus nasalidis]
MYTYIPKEQIKIYRYLTVDAVNAVLASLRREAGINLEIESTVGTAGNFVTQNDGVDDLDYQLKLLGQSDKQPADLLAEISRSLTEGLAGKFEAGRESRQALTFLHRAKKSGKVNFKLDLTIVKEEDGDEYRLIKENGAAEWGPAFNVRFLKIQEETIKDWDQWEDLRSEYLRLKNENPADLSVDLYRQAVNNIYG